MVRVIGNPRCSGQSRAGSGPGARIGGRTVARAIVKLVSSAVIAASAILTSPPAAAGPLGEGCVEDFWMWSLRSASRVICDGERQADGSWKRVRGFFDAGYWTRPYSSCSGGAWSSTCTYYEKEWVPELRVIDPAYFLTDATIPGGEPGWIPSDQPRVVH